MYKKLTDEEKKALEKFPKYDDKPEHWVGSRDYWECIFETETNRDPQLHEEFSKLHEDIVNMVVAFCKKHDLDVDEVDIFADGLRGSRDFGEWCPCTDSSMSMYVMKNENETDHENPFLYEF